MKLLSVEEIIRELERYRYDVTGATMGGHRVPFKVFADYVNMPRQTLQGYITRAFKPSDAARERLSVAMHDIREGRLRFVKRKYNWFAEGEAVKGLR